MRYIRALSCRIRQHTNDTHAVYVGEMERWRDGEKEKEGGERERGEEEREEGAHLFESKEELLL